MATSTVASAKSTLTASLAMPRARMLTTTCVDDWYHSWRTFELSVVAGGALGPPLAGGAAAAATCWAIGARREAG